MSSSPSQTSELAEAEQTATTFVFVRHGQTVWNSQERWQGWLDSPLTEEGRAQARSAGESVRRIRIDAVYSSDSGRAMDTARIILGDRTQVHVIAAPALRERHYGGYEGLSTPEIEARFPGSRYNPDRDDRDTWRAPGEGGESLEEVRRRVQAFVAETAAKHPGETVLAVTHSNVVRIIDSLSCGQPVDAIWERAPHNACVFILRATPDGELSVVQHFCQD